MKKDLQGGLQNILDAINNLIEPKLGNLKYDRTYRGKITSNEGDNTYKVLVNGKEYSAIYTGNKIPVGQIVKVKAPLNNFSDIYIETLPGSGGGEEGDYNSLVNKPILNTNNTETQVAKTAETIQGTISLHKISKTGNYNDLLNKPSLDFIPISEKGQPNGVASLDENGKIVKSDLPADTVYDNNYVHTDNNFTNALKDKLDSVEEGAEPNVIEVIQKNGTALPITNKTVNVEVPTKTSDILNDSGFITNTVDNLTNYYNKTETYTQTQVDNLLNNNAKEQIKTAVYIKEFVKVSTSTNVAFKTMFPNLSLDKVVCFNIEIVNVYETWDRTYAHILYIPSAPTSKRNGELQIRSYASTQNIAVRVTAFYRE